MLYEKKFHSVGPIHIIKSYLPICFVLQASLMSMITVETITDIMYNYCVYKTTQVVIVPGNSFGLPCCTLIFNEKIIKDRRVKQKVDASFH